MWFTGRGDTNLYHDLRYPQDSFMHFIEFPDVKGPGCNVKFNQVYMNGRRALGGLPNMPNYNLGPVDGSVCDTLGLDAVGVNPDWVSSENTKPKIYPNPSGTLGAVLRIPLPQRMNRVCIYDATGKLIWETQSVSDTIHLPGHLPAGLYRVVVNGSEGESWVVEL